MCIGISTNEYMAPAECYCQGKTEVFGGQAVPLPLRRPQIPRGMTWY